jgi:branched-chain amino acid transport system ATP-binding protein
MHDVEKSLMSANKDQKPILEIRNLSMTFGGLLAFKDVSLDIEPGEIVGLIGPNGAGKTTLINCITGVYQPTTGSIHFNRHGLAGKRPHQICRMGIGRTFQIPRPFMYMTVLDNIKVCDLEKNTDFRAILDFAGLWEKRNHLAKSLTFQERRLLELSRALAVNPKLLLLDETIAGLNPAETAEMMVLLRRIHQNYDLSILWIEHVMSAIMENAHKVVCLHQGSLIAQGCPSDIACNPKVVEAYLGEEYQFGGQGEC